MESTSLVKSFLVLEAMAHHGQPMSLADVTAHAAMSKPNCHRILKTLIALGYVRQTRDRNYLLTQKLMRLTMANRDVDLVKTVDPVLLELREQTGETVNFAVLHGETLHYLAVHESTHALRRVAEPGEHDPFFATALGRALVSQLEPIRQEHLLEHVSFKAHTEKTITDPTQIREILARARVDGYAVEQDQCDLGVTCIGAAVMVEDQPVAAISLSIPTARCEAVSLSDLINAVCTAASEAGHRLLTQRNRDEL